MKRYFHLLLACLITIILFGCSTNPSIIVNVEAIESRPLEIHLIGMDEDNIHKLMEFSVSEYWEPFPIRLKCYSKSIFKMYFYRRKTEEKLPGNHQVWQYWEELNVDCLMVIVNFPLEKDYYQTPENDPRRAFFPLKHWNLRRKIKLKITPEGIFCN